MSPTVATLNELMRLGKIISISITEPTNSIVQFSEVGKFYNPHDRLNVLARNLQKHTNTYTWTGHLTDLTNLELLGDIRIATSYEKIYKDVKHLIGDINDIVEIPESSNIIVTPVNDIKGLWSVEMKDELDSLFGELWIYHPSTYGPGNEIVSTLATLKVEGESNE